ncbi:hypothetical protein SAMN06265378_1168 [Paracoccus sediminis]|uniref:Uncharacterized protein n=1 Tax=Paracoccus sediminis TaxID=1214787 RepID=A0A238YA85_9RHOB|nr:hypothetical protein SAMN06265378_1168 [Paracoccus sediminis]
MRRTYRRAWLRCATRRRSWTRSSISSSWPPQGLGGNSGATPARDPPAPSGGAPHQQAVAMGRRGLRITVTALSRPVGSSAPEGSNSSSRRKKAFLERSGEVFGHDPADPLLWKSFLQGTLPKTENGKSSKICVRQKIFSGEMSKNTGGGRRRLVSGQGRRLSHGTWAGNGIQSAARLSGKALPDRRPARQEDRPHLTIRPHRQPLRRARYRT